MNDVAQNAGDIRAFLVSVRYRLWARYALECLRSMLWQLALLLSILAAVHYTSSRVNGWVVLICTLAILVSTIVRVLIRPPSLAACAAFVDRRFSRHALLTTAIECFDPHAATRNKASQIVLQQAADATKSLRPEINGLIAPRGSVSAGLAVIPAFAAIVLLSMPGAEHGPGLAERMTGQSPGTVDVETNGVETNRDDIAALRDTLSAEPARENATQDSGRQRERSGSLTPAENSSDELIVQTTESLPENIATSSLSAATSSGNGDLPGDTAAHDRPRTEDSEPDPRFRAREVEELERSGTAIAARSGQFTNFSDATISLQAAGVRVLPAAAPDTSTQWTMLTPAQAAYARRYLVEQEITND